MSGAEKKYPPLGAKVLRGWIAHNIMIDLHVGLYAMQGIKHKGSPYGIEGVIKTTGDYESCHTLIEMALPSGKVCGGLDVFVEAECVDGKDDLRVDAYCRDGDLCIASVIMTGDANLLSKDPVGREQVSKDVIAGVIDYYRLQAPPPPHEFMASGLPLRLQGDLFL